jgi:hypothetical protein
MAVRLTACAIGAPQLAHAHTGALFLPVRDPLTGKWIRAPYKAELHEPAARYAE